MEAKGLRIEELRATNYVRYFDGKEGEVSELGNFSYFSWIEEDWSGIPLTEEWLLRLGFKIKPLNEGFYLEDWRFHISSPMNYDGFLLCEEYKVITDIIEYVHELQNLYFALTGEELKTNS